MAEKNTIARPYARALFDMASQVGKLAEWGESLEALSDLAQNDELQSLLDNPRVSRDQLRELMAELASGKPEEVVRLTALLAENRRIDYLPEISVIYAQMRAEAESTQDVTVISAFPLKDAQKEALIKALSARLGRSVSLTSEVDESLIGGVVIRAGDLVIDGTITGQLDALSRRLMH